MALACLLSACGQRGPLYLPDDPEHAGPAAAQTAAPERVPADDTATGDDSEREDADTVFSSDFDSDDDRR